jgi:hypothetical protein
MQKKQELPDKDWKTFSNWERTYKSKDLKDLTIDSAFAIFSELWDLQNRLSEEESDRFRKRKIERLVALRRSFNQIQGRLHA